MTAAALKIVDEELETITNARFLTVGTDKQVVGGTLNGQTFYSNPIIEIDGDIIRTASGSYRFRSFH
jgi:hypothetical protein